MNEVEKALDDIGGIVTVVGHQLRDMAQASRGTNDALAGAWAALADMLYLAGTEAQKAASAAPAQRALLDEQKAQVLRQVDALEKQKAALEQQVKTFADLRDKTLQELFAALAQKQPA